MLTYEAKQNDENKHMKKTQRVPRYLGKKTARFEFRPKGRTCRLRTVQAKSSLFTVIPLIWPFLFIASTRSSAQRIKRCDHKGSPCLRPLEKKKEFERWPYRMELLIFLEDVLTHFRTIRNWKTLGLRGESSIAPNRTLPQNQLRVVSRLGY